MTLHHRRSEAVTTRIRSAVAAIAASFVVIIVPLVVVAPARAQNAPPSGGGGCSNNCWANGIEFEDLDGSFMGWYDAAKSNSAIAKHFDWSTDGCSVPDLGSVAVSTPFGTKHVNLNAIAAKYSAAFLPACKIHDFGYRNFGKGSYTVTEGDDNADPRKSVDDRLHANMDSICATNPPPVKDFWDKPACDGVAKVFYDAVRVGGGSHW